MKIELASHELFNLNFLGAVENHLGTLFLAWCVAKEQTIATTIHQHVLPFPLVGLGEDGGVILLLNSEKSHPQLGLI